MAEIRCPIGTLDRDVARAAATWVSSFHPEASVVIEGETALVASKSHTVSELRAIWLSALANERFLGDRLAMRRDALERLAR